MEAVLVLFSRSPMLALILEGRECVEVLSAPRQRRGCRGCRRPWLCAIAGSFLERELHGREVHV